MIRNSQHKQRFPYWQWQTGSYLQPIDGVYYFRLQSFPIMGQINGTNCTQMEHLLCLLQQSHFVHSRRANKEEWSSFFAHLCICSIFTIITFTTITHRWEQTSTKQIIKATTYCKRSLSISPFLFSVHSVRRPASNLVLG